MGQILSSAGEEPSPVASANRSESVNGGKLGGHPPTVTVRTISQGGTSGSDQIHGANGSNRASVVSNPGPTSLSSNMGLPMEPITPREVSANCWVAESKSFGSVAVQNGVSDATKSADTNRPPPPLSSAPSNSSSHPAPPSSTPPSVAKFHKKSIAKLFQGPSTQSVPNPPHEVASLASRSASLPSQHSQGQPYPPSFPSGLMRQGQNGNPSAPPRSPVYSRPMTNGQNGGVGVSGRLQAGSAPAAMPSPRLTPHAPPGPLNGMPLPQTMWPGYYHHPQFVPGVPPDQFYQRQWHGHLIPPQHQQLPQHHPSGAGPPSAALPMSPRNLPIQLQQAPGTPTQSHAVLPMHHPPNPSVPHQPPSITSPPPTPSTANRTTSFSANAGAFVPGKKFSIKNPNSGQEVNIGALKRVPLPVVPVTPPSPASSSKKVVKRFVQMETEEQKEKRLAEERAKEGESDERPRSSDSLTKANEDAARRQMEEREHRKAEERKLKEETERAEKERKEAEEWAAREERERKEAEEAKEAAEQRRKAEEEALRAAEATRTLADADAQPDSLSEEGEILDEISQPTTTEEILPSKPASVSPPPAPIPTDLSAKSSENGPLRIYTSIPSLPSPEHQRKRPQPLNLQTAITSNTPPALPSTLATARHIEDINCITYPEGIKSPNAELNVNPPKGKFRYDRDFLLQFMNICTEKPNNLPLLDVIGLEPSANRSVSVSGGQLGSRPPTMGTIREDGTGSRNRIRSKRGANAPNRASAVSNPGATSPIFATPPTIPQVYEAPTKAQEKVASMRQDVGTLFTSSRPSAISEQPKSKIDENVKDFFSVRMLDVAESYFSSLPTENRHRLVGALVMTSIEMKEPDVKLVGDLFVRVREKGLCSPAAFEEGFNELADLLDDLAAMVVPKAWSYFAILLKGSGLDQDEERYARIAEKTTDPDRLNQLL